MAIRSRHSLGHRRVINPEGIHGSGYPLGRAPFYFVYTYVSAILSFPFRSSRSISRLPALEVSDHPRVLAMDTASGATFRASAKAGRASGQAGNQQQGIDQPAEPARLPGRRWLCHRLLDPWGRQQRRRGRSKRRGYGLGEKSLAYRINNLLSLQFRTTMPQTTLPGKTPPRIPQASLLTMRVITPRCHDLGTNTSECAFQNDEMAMQGGVEAHAREAFYEAAPYISESFNNIRDMDGSSNNIQTLVYIYASSNMSAWPTQPDDTCMRYH